MKIINRIETAHELIRIATGTKTENGDEPFFKNKVTMNFYGDSIILQNAGNFELSGEVNKKALIVALAKHANLNVCFK